MPAMAINPGLQTSARIPSLSSAGERTTVFEFGVLLAAGALAAVATQCIDFELRVPGNAILKAVLPLSFGLALVPRRLGGSVMGASALATAFLFPRFGVEFPGAGKIVSLSFVGPLLDVALWRAQAGWSLYARFALAGLVANVAAFASRGIAKLLASGLAEGRPFRDWLSVAPATYALCGIVAGLFSAFVFFRLGAAPPAESAPKADA